MIIPLLKAKYLLLRAAAVLAKEDLGRELSWEEFLSSPTEAQLQSAYETLQHCKAGDAQSVCSDIAKWLKVIAEQQIPMKGIAAGSPGTVSSTNSTSGKFSSVDELKYEKPENIDRNIGTLQGKKQTLVMKIAEDKYKIETQFIDDYINNDTMLKGPAKFVLKSLLTFDKTRSLATKIDELFSKPNEIKKLRFEDKIFLKPENYLFYLSSPEGIEESAKERIIRLRGLNKEDIEKRKESQTIVETILKEGDFFKYVLAGAHYYENYPDPKPFPFQWKVITQLNTGQVDKLKSQLQLEEFNYWISFLVPKEYTPKSTVVTDLQKRIQTKVKEVGIEYLDIPALLDFTSAKEPVDNLQKSWFFYKEEKYPDIKEARFSVYGKELLDYLDKANKIMSDKSIEQAQKKGFTQQDQQVRTESDLQKKDRELFGITSMKEYTPKKEEYNKKYKDVLDKSKLTLTAAYEQRGIQVESIKAFREKYTQFVEIQKGIRVYKFRVKDSERNLCKLEITYKQLKEELVQLFQTISTNFDIYNISMVYEEKIEQGYRGESLQESAGNFTVLTPYFLFIKKDSAEPFAYDNAPNKSQIELLGVTHQWLLENYKSALDSLKGSFLKTKLSELTFKSIPLEMIATNETEGILGQLKGKCVAVAGTTDAVGAKARRYTGPLTLRYSAKKL